MNEFKFLRKVFYYSNYGEKLSFHSDIMLTN